MVFLPLGSRPSALLCANLSASPALQSRLVAVAIEPMPMSPEQFGEYIKMELNRYVALAKERNIRLDE